MKKKGFAMDIIYAVLIVIVILVIALIAYNYIIGKKSSIGFFENLAGIFKSAEEKRFDELKRSMKEILNLKDENKVNNEYQQILDEITSESQKPENINLIVKYEELKFELEKTRELALLNIEYDKINYPKSLNDLKNRYVDFSQNLPAQLSELKAIADNKKAEIEKIEKCNFETESCTIENSKGYCFSVVNKCISCNNIKTAVDYRSQEDCQEDPCKTIERLKESGSNVLFNQWVIGADSRTYCEPVYEKKPLAG